MTTTTALLLQTFGVVLALIIICELAHNLVQRIKI